MSQSPQPLFETFERFHGLNFLHLHNELPVVRDFLLGFPQELHATDGYMAVRGFLKSYAGNEATFNSYRTHAERLLLWSLLLAGKPLLKAADPIAPDVQLDGDEIIEVWGVVTWVVSRVAI